jgi:CBS domain-containing protein
MTVKAILSRKGNAVITIEPTVPLCDAVKILDEHRNDTAGRNVHAIRHNPRDHGAHDRGQVSPSACSRARQARWNRLDW